MMPKGLRADIKCRYKDTKYPWNIGSKGRNRYIVNEADFIKMQCYEIGKNLTMLANANFVRDRIFLL